jgi:hypothetical protein
LTTLSELGLAPELQRSTSFNRPDESAGALENIVCRLKGSSQQKAVLLVAHYDSIAGSPGASDDGAGVAALLEGARALKSLPQLRRDIIFLFTDGEEEGLLGARAFVSEHPWARDPDFVLNFEARGNSGPSIMFETSDKADWLVKKFGKAADPIANSLSYEIYKRLPNDTDFTVFRRSGFSGLNFAFIEGLPYYHTAFDSARNLDLGSLQHQGDYLLQLTRELGNSAEDDPRSADAIYFDVLGEVLVTYKQGTAIFLLALAALLVAIHLWQGFRKKVLRLSALLTGAGTMLSGLIVTIAGAAAASLIAEAIESPKIRAGLTYRSGWYVLAFSMIGLGCGTAIYQLAAKQISPESLVSGVLLVWLALGAWTTFYFSGGSFLFVWPLLFAALGSVVMFEDQIPVRIRKFLFLFGSVPAIFLIVPLAHEISWAFASQSTWIVSVVLGLLLSLLAGPMAIAGTSRWWHVPLLYGIAGAGIFSAAVVLSGTGRPLILQSGYLGLPDIVLHKF